MENAQKIGKLVFIALISILVLSGVQAVWQPYIIANWTFDNTYNEQINNYVGSSSAPFVTGYVGQAVNVTSGSIGYGEIYNLGGYNQNPSNVTIVSIIKLSPNFNSSYRSILASDSIGLGGQYGFNLEVIGGNKIRVYYGYYSSASDGNKNTRDSIYSIPLDKWIILTGTMYNQTEMRIFLNGVEVKGINNAGWTDMSQRSDIAPFEIGNNAKGGAFKGLIDNTYIIRNYINVSDAYEIASLFGLQDNPKKQPRLNSSLDTMTSYNDWTNLTISMNYSGYLAYPDYVLNAVDNTTYPELYDCNLYVDNSFQDLKSNVNLSQQNYFSPVLPVVNRVVPIRVDCANAITNGSKTWNLNVNTLPLDYRTALNMSFKFNDPTDYLINEVNNVTGVCQALGLGFDYPSYFPYTSERQFDESWLFPDGTFGKSCYIPSSMSGMTGMTINLWFRPHFYKPQGMTLISFMDSYSTSNPIHYLAVTLSNTTLYTSYPISIPLGTSAVHNTPYNFSDQTWYMLTISMGANGMKHYVNGQLIGVNTTFTSWGTSTYLIIGHQCNSCYTFGRMDELNFWARQFKDGEVAKLYTDHVEVMPEIKENTTSADVITEDLVSYHTYDYEVKDDLGYITYQPNSAIIVNDADGLGVGSLYCRGTGRGVSNNTPFFNYSTVSSGSLFKVTNNEIANDYLYSVDGQGNYIASDQTLVQNGIGTDGFLPKFNDSQWHSTITTYKPIEKRFYRYVDGQLFSTTKDRRYIKNFGNSASICSWGGGNSKAWIDEEFAFNRTLSDDEVSFISVGYQLVEADIPPAKCYDVINCPIRRYTLDEVNSSNVNDNGLDGIDATTTYTATRPMMFINRGVPLNDTTKDITIPSANTLDFWDATDFSLSFWYSKVSNPSNTQSILRHLTSNNNEFSTNVYQLSGGQVYACIGRQNSVDYCTTSAVLTNNAWNMVTLTFNRTDESLKLFINETKVANTTLPSVDTIPSNADWQVKEATVGREFSFKIDELRFYDWDITPQVPQLYNYLVSLRGCTPQYEQTNSSCTTNNTYEASYYDVIQCGLPPLNNTILPCDYCVPQVSQVNGTCQINVIPITFQLDNFATCCNVTNDANDCSTPQDYTVPCVKVGYHSLLDLPNIITDFFVEYMLVFIGLIGLLMLLLLVVLFKYLRDKGYI